LRTAQSRAFARADGVVFLTETARDRITRRLPRPPRRTAVIPHGIDERFFQAPRPARRLADCTADAPFEILYVSIVDVYKHQDRVAEAVTRLRAEGLPVALRLVGPAYPPALQELNETLDRIDPRRETVRYEGAIPFGQLHQRYHAADLFVFASSCENLPIILLEAMAAGLPIASADRDPMPEVLGAAGTYFDPTDAGSIADAVRGLCHAPERRAALARAAQERARGYRWDESAQRLFAFLATCAER
ncbi:MAG: glycosyltransferase, partial [Planctomycetota bacterium]